MILKSKNFWVLTKIILGMIILYLLFKKIGFIQIYEALSSMQHPVIYILIAFGLLVMTFFMSAINLYILTSPIKKISLKQLFNYVSASWSAGFLLPVADVASLSYFLKKEGIDWGPGLVINFFDKIIALIIFSTLTLFAFLKFLPTRTTFILLATLITIMLSILFAFSKKGRYLIRKFILRKYSKLFKGFSVVLKWYLKKKKKLFFLSILVLSIKLYLTAAVVYTLFLSVGIKVPITEIMLVTAAILTTKLVAPPLKIMGLREVISFSIALLLYAQLGVPAAKALGVYVVVSLLTYAYALLTVTFLDHKKLTKPSEQIK